MNGIGEFISWKISLDLIHLGLFGDIETVENQYVQLGPGAKKGLSILCTTGDINGYLRQLQAYLSFEYKYFYFYFVRYVNARVTPKLTLAALEQSLCEFNKVFKANMYHNPTEYVFPSIGICYF